MGCAETGNVDHLRGMTRYADGSRAIVGEFAETIVELCPGARIYSLSLSACVLPDTLEVPDILAVLKLQDSTIELPSCGCKITSLNADFPGLAWPAFARLEAAAGVFVTLQLWYGQCA